MLALFLPMRVTLSSEPGATRLRLEAAVVQAAVRGRKFLSSGLCVLVVLAQVQGRHASGSRSSHCNTSLYTHLSPRPLIGYKIP